MKKSQLGLFFWGGLLPLLLFTLIEEKYGPVWGTIAAMIYGIGEISYEKIRYKKIEKITLWSNFFIFILGMFTVVTQEGIWFKMQPAILEFGFFAFLLISYFRKKNILSVLMRAQGQTIPAPIEKALPGMSVRFAIFFLLHSILATWAAFYWSTEAWVILKGVGLTVSMVLYILLEGLFLRRSLLRLHSSSTQAHQQNDSK